MDRFVMFIEVVRAMDYWGISAYPDSVISERSANRATSCTGENRAVAELFEPLGQPGAFRLIESTQESRGFAVGLLEEFGKVSLTRRLADMGEWGIMKIAKDSDGFDIRMSEDARAQFADAMEVDHLKVAEECSPSSNRGGGKDVRR